jgi:hypothetical protein
MKKLLILVPCICALVLAQLPARAHDVSFGIRLPFPFLFYNPARAHGVSSGIPLPFPFLFYDFGPAYSQAYYRPYYARPYYYRRAYYYGGYGRPRDYDGPRYYYGW